MAFQEKKKFTFVSKGLPEETFSVVRFKGVEGISKLYEFDITLVSEDPEIDLKEVLQSPATFTLAADDQDFPVHGVLSQFEQLHEANQYIFYRAVLVPRLWQSDLYHENQLFLDKSVPDIIKDILKQAGLTTKDYEINLGKKYKEWEFICQYKETDFDFISRWMEREGIYYYFEQTEAGEKLIITDSLTRHQDIPGEKTISYSPPSGLIPSEGEVVKALVCKQKTLPGKVVLKDYNYRKPHLDLRVEARVDLKGRGEVYIYGEHYKTPEEGKALAKIRAEELLSQEKLFHGESTAPAMCPGFFFELSDHYRESYNAKYLITEIEHEGTQAAVLLGGIEGESAEGEKEPGYSNRFTLIPAEVQFRPERKTPKPRFNGTMNATVDASGIGQHAEIDDEGRYKVILPFDMSGRFEGKASRWVRMMQPSAGRNSGMHFPLQKGTEVMLTFVDGDPDRPVIAGAVPNSENASPITSANQTKSVISTGKGPETHSVGAALPDFFINLFHRTSDNYIEFEDKDGEEHIRINSKGNLWLEANERYGDYHIGNPELSEPKRAPSDAPAPKIGELLDKFGPGTEKATGKPKPYNPTGLQSRHGTTPSDYDFEKAFKQGHVHVSSFDTINTQEGNVYDFGGYWVYNLGNCYIENHMEQGQKAELNQLKATVDKTVDKKPDGTFDTGNKGYDMLNQGGPNWTDWRPVGTGTNPPTKNVLNDETDKVKYGDWANGKVWVEKKFGGTSYAYNDKSHSIEINDNCSTHNINISGRHIEEKYSGTGHRTLHSVSESGEKEETKYDRYNGNKYYYGHSKTVKDGVLSKFTSTEEKYNRNKADTKVSWAETIDSKDNLKSTVKKYRRDTGDLVSQSVTTDSGGNIDSKVWKYDRDAPWLLVSHSHTIDKGLNVASYKYDMHTKESWTFDLGNLGAIAGSLSFNNKQKFDFNFGILNTNFSTYLGGKIDISHFDGLYLKWTGGWLGLGIEINTFPFKLEKKGLNKLEFTTYGLTAEKKSEIELEDGKFSLKNKLFNIFL